MAVTHQSNDPKEPEVSYKTETQHVDLAEEVAIEAEGDGALVPKGYWTSATFLGSATAIMLTAHNLFLGYLWPVRVFIIPKQKVRRSQGH